MLTTIIVSWNTNELLDACLLSLREEFAREEFAREEFAEAKANASVWVIDNASQDGSAAMVRERHPWVHLEALDENIGYVRGNNLAIERVLRDDPPDFLWLLNPDTVVQPGALSALLAFFAAHPRAGLVGPQLLNPDGTLQQGAFRFPRLFQPLFDLGLLPNRFYNTRLNGRYPVEKYQAGQPFRIDHPLGAAMMARSTAVREVGPLDERFFMYCEEIDWAWRMRKAGWEAWLVPAAKIVHHGGASSGQARPATTAHLWESRARLYRKHHGSLTRAIVGALVRRAFARQPAPSPAWEAAHYRIMEAWS